MLSESKRRKILNEADNIKHCAWAAENMLMAHNLRQASVNHEVLVAHMRSLAGVLGYRLEKEIVEK